MPNYFVPCFTFNNLRRRLGIVMLGACVSAEPRLYAALVSAAKVMRCIQCSVVYCCRCQGEFKLLAVDN